MNIGFIDYYLDEWHANNYPAWIRKATDGRMAVTHAFALIDSPMPGGRTSRAWCDAMGVTLCASIEDVVAACDALVVLSPNNAEFHEQLCQIPLRSGKPTYVDKTFAPDGDCSRRLFALAEESGTPCVTSSALRYAAEYRDIDPSGIRAIASWGPGDLETYAIHQVEPLLMLMRSPVVRVLYAPGERFYTLLLSFADGRAASVTGFEDGSPFQMNLCDKSGNRTVEVKSDFFAVFITDLIAFFDTGKPSVSAGETNAVMDVLTAGKKASQAPGTWVAVG